MNQTTRPPYTGGAPGSTDGLAPRGSRPPARKDAPGTGGAFDARHAVVLFDPATDTSPYAASKRSGKKKGRQPARPSASGARPSASASRPAASAPRSASGAPRPGTTTARGGTRPAGANPAPYSGSLRIVPDDDPGTIRRYAEAQHISDAQRRAGASVPGHGVPTGTAPTQARQPYTSAPTQSARPATSIPAPAPAPIPTSVPGASRPGTATARPARDPRTTDAAGWPAGRTADRPASRPAGQPAGQGEGRPTGRPAGQPAGQPSDRPAGRHEQQRADQPSGRQSSERRPSNEGRPFDGQTSAPAWSTYELDDDGKPAARRSSRGTGTGAGQSTSFARGEGPASNAPFGNGAPHARQVHAQVNSERAWRIAIVWVTAVSCVLASLVMLYFPAQNLYLAMRENERLTDELERNNERNDQMLKRIETLQSTEGIQDEAHRLYNLVLPGENSVAVVGADYEEPSNAIPEEVPRGSGQNTTSWVTDLLDGVFGVTGPSASTATVKDVATIVESDADSNGTANPDADIVAQGDVVA